MTSQMPAPSTAPTPARIGRPPRIDREAIARAVIELGFDGVTMKSTAEHLGVSVPGLYHYVKGRDELMRMAAEYSLANVELPRFTGQGWRPWLSEWAHYTRSSMTAHPELLQHFLAGSIDSTRKVEVVDVILAVLVDHGFDPVDAAQAWGCISAFALGAAAADISESAAIASGHPWISRVHGVLARHTDDELAATRALVARGHAPDADRDFERRLHVVLDGIETSGGGPKAVRSDAVRPRAIRPSTARVRPDDTAGR